MGKRKSSEKKRRIEKIFATTAGAVDRIAVHYDPSTGRLSFEQPVINAYTEISYERATKPKIVSRVPSLSGSHGFDPDLELKNFDHIFAVDTNTKELGGLSISITAIVSARKIIAVNSKGDARKAFYYRVPFLANFVGGFTKPEVVGWSILIDEVVRSGEHRSFKNIGVIVDSELGMMSGFNARRVPLFGDTVLPERFTLIYASSDKSDGIANDLMKMADRAASTTHDHLAQGGFPLNRRAVTAPPVQGHRILIPKGQNCYPAIF